MIILIIINQDFLWVKSNAGVVASKVKYKYFLISVTLFYIADIAWGLLFDLKIAPFAYIDTIIFFLLMVTSVFLWTRYVIAYINKKRFSVRC